MDPWDGVWLFHKKELQPKMDAKNSCNTNASEYIVDMYSRIEKQELSYILHSQSSGQGKKDTELPASFLGSRHWSSENTADGLAIAHSAGRPTFFITMTCNLNWPEIKARLAPGQSAADAPVIVAKVFKIRLQRFMQQLRKKFGKLIYMIKVIEFQFRGLPHAHLILQVEPELPVECMDQLITYQLPENDLDL
ncbi:hypothetical protein M422DRAFT_261710 [Sphaerobolus stellatus SS14]|uniref:Helitron helicase-like domain-containing protein n=1 Tax=Sphaerobolus stellatus (strain SS14) TaxID=990650 RepID=A0A0C9TZZ2_SPHS4|nr:hypothetical protein M422DRAFT_261710 [Sphaerobolus stellatus SS14]